MHKVLITGITGKSGKYLLEEFTNHAHLLKDYEFKVFIRKTSNTEYIDKASKYFHIEKFVGNMENIDDVQAFCQGNYDTLLHIQGIQNSINLVKAALMNNTKRFILIHTTGAFSKFKAAGEEYRRIDKEVISMIEQANAVYTILRPTMIYGSLNDCNLSQFIKMVDKLRIFPIVSGGKFALQPVWCKDLGQAYYNILMNEDATKNKCYNLSGGNEIYLIDMLKEIGKQLGVKNTFVSVPFWIAYSGAWVLYLVSFTKVDFREKVQRLVEPRVFSHEDATRDFGYQPKCFETGIVEEIEMYKKANHKKES